MQRKLSYKFIYNKWILSGETPVGKLLRAYDLKYQKILLEHRSSAPRIFYPNGTLILFLDNVPPQKKIPTYCEVLLEGQKGRLMVSSLKFSFPEND